MRLRACLLGLLLVHALPSMAASVDVQVAGEVRQPGTIRLPAGSRFADAVLSAMPDPRSSYPLAAAALRVQAEPAQRRLKAGLLFDLQALAEAPDSDAPLRARAEALHRWVQSLPVTGRVMGQLDPRRLEVDRASNRVLAAGDRFIYPPRPATVTVVGAVAQSCTLKHEALRDARAYLRDCAPDADADPNALFVIQPDGQVQQLGIAAWNRGEPQSLAPGAVVYVPLDERLLRGQADTFNADLAAFLATQVLPVATP
jgi:hypothetical protein